MNYLKVTLQELIKNDKETNIANILKGIVRQHEKEKIRETIREINKHCSPTHGVESPGWESMTNLST